LRFRLGATGDLAEVDAEGYISIKGRKKEMIVSSSGKKIFPARIESLFRLEPVVSQIVPMGDGQPHVTALVTVESGIAEGLAGPEAVAREVQDAVARVNRHLAPNSRVGDPAASRSVPQFGAPPLRHTRSGREVEP
jgi:long-chain acyl-CoA synthetase